MNGRRKEKLFSGHHKQRADTGCCLKDETRGREEESGEDAGREWGRGGRGKQPA